MKIAISFLFNLHSTSQTTKEQDIESHLNIVANYENRYNLYKMKNVTDSALPISFRARLTIKYRTIHPQIHKFNKIIKIRYNINY